MTERQRDGAAGAGLHDGMSVSVASVAAGNRPVVGRGLGCRVEPDGRTVTVLLDRAACAGLLEAIADTGRIAVVLTEPSTHRSVQIKGEGARIGTPPADAAGLIAHHIDSFARELALIGFDEDFTRTLTAHDPADLVAVWFTAGALFDQTPGPKAGEPLPP